jgi:hypothetical protein
MTDRAQFEAMLEALINDDQASAKEIFHNIVVGKSREIYEELLAEDFSQDSGNPYGKDKDEEDMSEDGEEMEEEDMEEEGMEEEGADSEEESDDEEGDDSDSEEDPFGGEDDGEEGEGDIEDRVMDLEDALEDLKAEFEQLLAGEEHEEENEPGIHGDGMPMHDIESEMDEMPMMEYVNKVPAPKHGDNGANTRSLIDNMKNDMGGSSKNIAQNHVEVHGDAGTRAGGTQGGLLKPTPGDLVGQEVHNRPGKTDAGKKSFKKQVEGGGIDRQNSFKAKGNMAGARTGELGGQRGEQNTKSLISKRVR